MPVSTPIHLPHCLALINGLAPRSVLDIGLGFGTWGFLCRTHLDVFPGRVQPKDWITRIDGVELFEPYIQTHQRALYNHIQIADIRDAAPRLEEYDLIIAGDVIEHLDKDDACAVLDTLYAKACGALLVNIPIGDTGWEHGENHGNPGELHRSAWFPEDFQQYPHHHEAFTLPNGAYGVFWCPKNVPREARFSGLVAAANYARERGRTERALTLIRDADRLSPGDPFVTVFHADLALECGHPAEAVQALESGLTSDAATHRNRLMLANLHYRLGHHDAARTTLSPLLELDSLAADVRAEANALAQRLGQH